MKKVEIKCTGADTASIDDFHFIQGSLKTLSEEGYQKLKHQILTYGYSEPVLAWDNDNKKKVVSGQRRIETLLRMRTEGHHVPYIPYNFVEAENEHEAKMKVLAMASQFGTVTTGGLREFMSDLDIDIPELDQHFALPGIDLPALFSDEDGTTDVQAHTRKTGVGEDPSNKNEYKTNAERLDNYLGSEIRRLALVMGPADYERLLAGLTIVCDSVGLNTHGEAVLYLWDQFNGTEKKGT